MAKCEFSETQFVMGWTREYFNKYRSMSPLFPSFYFPSTSQEPYSASDFLIKHLNHLEFYQFKRSDYLSRRMGKREAKSGVPKWFKPYYRFEIYNAGKHPQFNRLREISTLDRRFKTYYCAPRFHTYQEYQEKFWRDQIIENSVIIDCSQFNNTNFFPPKFDIDDGDKHFIVFNSNPMGYICSEAQEIEISTSLRDNDNIEFVSNNGNSMEMIDKLYHFIIKDAEGFQINIDKKIEDEYKRLEYSVSYLMVNYDIITLLKF